MPEFNVVCGGSEKTAPSTSGHTLRLGVRGAARNVNLQIHDISRAMVGNIPDVLLDLLEIAAYIYCADQRAKRGNDRLAGYGASWRRSLRFTIPVRRPDVWSSPGVLEPLQDTLSFLSDDAYEFTFVEAASPFTEREAYFPDLSDGDPSVDAIALFSGGIDSLAGAIDEISHGRRIALVGHHSAPQVFNIQKELVGHLRAGDARNRIFYVHVNVTNAAAKASEYTQRTRSFLFASLAFAIARMAGKDDFTFFENGVVSFNLPIARDVLGARATRTTHPKVLRGFEEIFSALAERAIAINTPFQWMTKKEVIQRIADSQYRHLLSVTSSCTKPRSWTRSRSHCGVCSQCVDRRFAVLAAGVEELDPMEHYGLDLLTGDWSLDADPRMPVAFVKFCQDVASSSRHSFVRDQPQVAAALQFLPGRSADEAIDRIFDLHQRHANDVLTVIRNGLSENADQLARGELPDNCLLSLCFSRNLIDVPGDGALEAQVKQFMDRLALPPREFAMDDEAEVVWFRGGFALRGAAYRLVWALVANHRAAKRQISDVPFMRSAALAKKLKIEELSLRRQIIRARKDVADRLAVDQGIVLGSDDFIENNPGHGYRLSPLFREVSRADLDGA
jgi:7-cyano-7-deazaguanine synthase in queuosine biosynthesis